MSVSFSPRHSYAYAPAQANTAQPRFSAKDTPVRAGHPSHQLDIEHGPNHDNHKSSACWTATKWIVGFLGLTAVVGALTSETWVPITGVAKDCRNHEPEGTTATLYPIAGLGPDEGICPSGHYRPTGNTTGEILINDAPSWRSFHTIATVDNGRVTGYEGIKGELVDGDDGVAKYYNGGLVKSHILQGLGSGNNESFEDAAKKGKYPAKTKVLEDGTVQENKLWGWVQLTKGKTHLTGDAKDKKLTDLPEAHQKNIKAAAADRSWLWDKGYAPDAYFKK